jgi:tetratricopeptide (TPR) repeat protein
VGILESETLDLDAPSSTGSALPSCCVGDTLSERYRLDEEIGRGGMGIVYRAWDVELERAVAVKVMAAHLEADDARDRLFREARAAAALSHPHVVAVHDVGEHEGMPYFVMELIDGPSLRDRSPKSLPEIVAVARQICDALTHAHDHGLVHRDLKPGNVLIEERPDGLSVKIVDLGLAVRDRGVRVTREGGISGTVSYMAPEQALGHDVDGRTDLYALGVILYELVTGRLPFEGDNSLAVLSQHLHAPVVPPRTYREDLPEDLDKAILRLLAKDPDERFATAAEAAASLELASDVAAAAPIAAPTPLGGLVRGRLVGRDVELDTLRRSWSQAAAGRGGMLLVSGEPGSGKTRLVRELVDYARITGGTVLSGGCYELEAATPYLPFVEALRSWVHESSDDELRAAVGDSGTELARLAPELSARIGPFPAAPLLSAAEERLRLFDGIARFLVDRASSGGLLLFVDDLQWADQASLSLLHYLVRLIGKESVLVVGCYRETELDRAHPLAEALDNWNRERAAARVHLKRFSAESTHAMLSVLLGDECLSQEFCASIHRETEGNPFFIEEVVKTLVEEGQIVCEAGGWRRRDEGERLVLPQGVKAAIGRRLDRMSPPTTEVLRIAAILGKTFAFSELAAVSDKGEDELLDALDEAVAAQLLETRSGETIVFTHDKIREVLYHELNPIRRRRLHTRIAEGLEAVRDRGGRVAVEDLAHHSMEGGVLDKGFEYAMEAAADATRVFAYTDALRLYERARECAEELGRDRELPAIDAAMGEVYALKGEPLAAAERYERALAAAIEPAEQVRLRCLIGEAYVTLGDARALTYLEEARTALDPETQPAEVARAAMIEARFHHYHGRSREAADRLIRAVAPAESSGDTTLMGWVYGYLAGAYQHLAEFGDSDRWAQRCIDIGSQRDVPSVTSIGFEFLVENSFMRGLWRQALDYVPQHRAHAERASSTDRLGWSYLGPTISHLGLGNLTEAEAAAKEGLDLAHRIGDERLAVFLGSWTAQVAADSGHLDEAAELAQVWCHRADALGLKSGQAEALRVQAYVAQRSEDHARVLESSSRAEAVLDGTDEKVNPVWFGSIICDSLIAVGRLDEAEERIRNNLEVTRAAGMPHWEAATLRSRGLLHLARGATESARDDFEATVTIFDDLGSRIELGRTLVLRAPLSTNPDEDLARARALFEACGASADLIQLG